ncbi:MAG: rhodanese [Planctomycetales bacterium]|nr:rhodanese [Planctomycetales bacterium]
MNELPWEISCQEVQRLRDAADGQPWLLLDCREPDEHAVAAVEGAELIPMSELADRAGELTGREDQRVVVMCHGGVRSLRVAHWLRAQGFPQAQSMVGGIDAWSQEIDPSVPRY